MIYEQYIVITMNSICSQINKNTNNYPVRKNVTSKIKFL